MLKPLIAYYYNMSIESADPLRMQWRRRVSTGCGFGSKSSEGVSDIALGLIAGRGNPGSPTSPRSLRSRFPFLLSFSFFCFSSSSSASFSFAFSFSFPLVLPFPFPYGFVFLLLSSSFPRSPGSLGSSISFFSISFCLLLYILYLYLCFFCPHSRWE